MGLSTAEVPGLLVWWLKHNKDSARLTATPRASWCVRTAKLNLTCLVVCLLEKRLSVECDPRIELWIVTCQFIFQLQSFLLVLFSVFLITWIIYHCNWFMLLPLALIITSIKEITEFVSALFLRNSIFFAVWFGCWCSTVHYWRTCFISLTCAYPFHATFLCLLYNSCDRSTELFTALYLIDKYSMLL